MAFKIRNKLLLAFMAILLPFFILTIINHYHQRIIYNASHEVHIISEEIQKVAHLQLNLNKLIMSVNDYIITGDKIYIDNFKKELTNLEDELKELKEIETVVSDRHIRIDKELEIIRDVEIALKGIEELSNKIFGITNLVGNKEAGRLMEEMDYKITYPTVDKLEVYNEIEREDYREAIRISDIAWKRSWIIRIIGTIIVIGISIFFALFYSRLFVLPIKQVHNGADAIAKGDFKVRLDIKTGDEIEQLSKAMNEMAKQLDALYLNMDEKIEEGIRKFAAITESANDAIIVLSSPDVIHFWNKKAEEMFGYSTDDVLGKSIHGLIAPLRFREKAKSGLDNFFKTGKGPIVGKVVEVFGQHKDGREFPIELSVSAVRIGGEWQAIGIIRDITERKRLDNEIKKNEERFRASIENMLDCFGIYSAIRDETGRITDFLIEYVNTAACENNQMRREEQIDKRLCELLPAHRTTGLFAEYCQVVETGKPLVKESFIYEDIYASQRITRVFDIHAVKLGDGFTASWRDITERKKTETELKHRLDELEQFRKVTIQREFRMEELKRKNKELEEELKIWKK